MKKSIREFKSELSHIDYLSMLIDCGMLSLTFSYISYQDGCTNWLIFFGAVLGLSLLFIILLMKKFKITPVKLYKIIKDREQ